MSQIFQYTVNEIPPTNNKYIGRTNRWEYQKEKKRWAGIVQAECRPKPQKPMEKALVIITYYFKQKRNRDPDNYSGKMLLDGLVRAGILKDDNFDCIELYIRQGGIDSKRSRTEIHIEEKE